MSISLVASSQLQFDGSYIAELPNTFENQNLTRFPSLLQSS